MKKVKLTDTDIKLLSEFNGCNTKQEMLEEFKKNYSFDEHIDYDWFETKEDYQSALNIIRERDTAAYKLIAKLNQMSDKDWEEYYG